MVKMGLVKTLFLTVSYELPITAENTGVFYRGNFTEKSPGFIDSPVLYQEASLWSAKNMRS